jgi:hypothetical protein
LSLGQPGLLLTSCFLDLKQVTASKRSYPALYRANQFFAAIKAVVLNRAGLTPANEVLITSILTTPAQQHLFARMSPNDRRHALAVVRTLQQAGYEQTPLLQAALLHDVAKSMGQPIIHRVLIVLLEAFRPAALKRLSETAGQQMGQDSSSSIPSWRRPFFIHAHHPAIGAAWAKEAACEPLAVNLIARHQERLTSEPAGEEENLLAILQWADNLN